MLAKLKSLLSGASTPVDDSSAHKKQGDKHLQLDQLGAAEAAYRRALSLNPNYVDACVGLGFSLAGRKEYGEAERWLRHALSLAPETADAHYILGTIAKDLSDHVESIDHFSRAIDAKADFEFAYRDLVAALLQSEQLPKAREVLIQAVNNCPKSAEFQFQLGNVFSGEGDYDNALACYQKGLSIQPDSADLHKGLGDTLAKRAQFGQAVNSYRKALWFAPKFVNAHLALGAVLRSQGQLDEAIACYREATTLEPENASTHQSLGNALLERGETKNAIACYERVVNLDPENPVRHLISALSGQDSERAPSAYVEQLFDQYAQKFDSHLVGVLAYSVPEKLVELLRPYAASQGERWVVLDLGCGTGLSGLAIAPYTKKLVGVDISSNMLEKARERNLYDRLEHLELLAMMQQEKDSAYDLVFAADVFVYLGRLDDLIEQAKRLLRPGGLFAFSVESLEALEASAAASAERREYQLNITGRYAHSSAYLARMAGNNGFEVLNTRTIESRLDQGKPVQGYAVLWRRSP